MIDDIVMKGKGVIIPFQLQKQILQELQSSHKEIEKMKLLVYKSVFGFNMYTDIENTVKQHATYLDYQNTEPQEQNNTPWAVDWAMDNIWVQVYFQ